MGQCVITLLYVYEQINIHNNGYVHRIATINCFIALHSYSSDHHITMVLTIMYHSNKFRDMGQNIE